MLLPAGAWLAAAACCRPRAPGRTRAHVCARSGWLAGTHTSCFLAYTAANRMATANKYMPVPESPEARRLSAGRLTGGAEGRGAGGPKSQRIGRLRSLSSADLESPGLALDESTEVDADIAPELLTQTTSSAVRRNGASGTDHEGAILHVRGVRAGPEAVPELTRIFSAFGKVEDVVVRERFQASERSATPVDSSWALVTMSTDAEAVAALRDGVLERMDPKRPLTLNRYNTAIAKTSTGAMAEIYRQANVKNLLVTQAQKQKARARRTLVGHSLPPDWFQRPQIRRNHAQYMAELSNVAEDGKFLRNVPLFADLPRGDLARLGGSLVREKFARGKAIIAQGEEGDAMFIIEEGRVHVEVDGKRVKTLNESEHFGELALAAEGGGGIRTATVRAGAQGARCYKLVRCLAIHDLCSAVLQALVYKVPYDAL